MKRKLSYIALVFVLLLGLCACGSMDAKPTASPVPEETATPAVTDSDWEEELMPDREDGIVDDNDGILDNNEDKQDNSRGILDDEGGILGNQEDNHRDSSSMTTDEPVGSASPNSGAGR